MPRPETRTVTIRIRLSEGEYAFVENVKKAIKCPTISEAARFLIQYASLLSTRVLTVDPESVRRLSEALREFRRVG